jgi:uncharacterized protein
MTTEQETNRLARETSPYLLQHAHNPVDWYPWSDEAFAAAREQDRPILLSVGYSACHWCHVMERESFENAEIAAQMNRDFVNVKVDREERPDVDSIYMSAVQRMTGQGGWPMTVFLTPEGKPFFGGTYFPPHDLYGRPGFPRLLAAVAAAWKDQRAEIEQQSADLTADLVAGDNLLGGLPDTLLTAAVLDNAQGVLESQFDRRNGGMTGAPKFPQPMNLDFLLRCHHRTKRQEPLALVERTLQRMALGGIYDQLGGGFHRYSTDDVWLVPHFEKMLYDNAQLAQVYCRAWQATGKSFYRGVAEEALEYVLREMTSPEGAFYSSQDADSEGEEGKFFVWTRDEVEDVLGKHDGQVFCAFYDVTAAGNWEGANILHVAMDAQEAGREFGLTVEETAVILDGGRTKLFEARESRIKPALDDKVLTSWNGLMMAAFAECGAAFDRADFRAAAVKNAEYILRVHASRGAGGRLRLNRTSRGGKAHLNGCLEDYAFYADALLLLYEATFERRWLRHAEEMTATIIALFADETPGGSGFFATPSDHEALIQRPRDWDDNAVPSGNSVAVDVLLRLAILTGNDSYKQRAADVLRRLAPVLEKHPGGFGRMLGGLDFYLSAPKEIALVGERTTPELRALLQAIRTRYLPNRVVAAGDGQSDVDLPLLSGRQARNGRPTAYVCESFACKEPVDSPEALAAQLST